MRVPDFVDALSAPLQFVSAAEKRAKQMQGLGIDEKDISDVSVSIKRRTDGNATSTAANGAVDGDHGQQNATNATMAGGGKHQSSHQAAPAQNDAAADKEKKGENEADKSVAYTLFKEQ